MLVKENKMEEVQLKQLPVKHDRDKTVRESAYVEPEFSAWLEDYAIKIGASRSNAMRRLMILGAQAEGHVFDGEDMLPEEQSADA